MQRGFSTIELLIASAVALLFLSATYVVVFSDQIAVSSADANTEAVAKTQDLLEKAQAQGALDLGLVNATSSSDGIYTKSVTVQGFPDFLTKLVTASTTWKGERGRALGVTMTTLVTDRDNVQSPNTCSSLLANPFGWKNPQHRVYDFGQLGINGGSGAGFGIADIKAFNGVLYVGVYAATTTYRDTLFTFRAPADPGTQMPVFLDSVDNATVDPGLQALAIASTTSKVYVYAASSYGPNFNTCVNTNGTNKSCAQLQLFDVTNPANLQAPIVSYKIPTTTPSLVKGSGGQASGNSIFYRNGYVYLGLTKTASGPEFNVIDVGGGGPPASPTNPIWKGGYTVGNDINAIYVRGKYAYIITPNIENMTIIDVRVSSPTFMQRVGGYSDPHAPNSEGVGSDHGETFAVVGNTAYLGRTYGTNEFNALNVTNPSNISTSTKDVGTGNQTSIYGIAIKNYLAFVMTKSQLQVWNIANLSSIQPWTTSGTTAQFSDAEHSIAQMGGAGASLDCEGDNLYTVFTSTSGGTKDMIGIIYPHL